MMSIKNTAIKVDYSIISQSLAACRNKNYKLVEDLLPAVINYAADNDTLYSAINSIIYEMAQYHVIEGSKKRAIELYNLLILLKETLQCVDCSEDCSFEKMAIDILKNEGASNQPFMLFKNSRFFRWIPEYLEFGKKSMLINCGWNTAS